jgi:glycosyltransferase involved in cell wall biosynthesis
MVPVLNRVLNILFDERVGGPQLRVLQVARQLRNRGLETVVVMPKGDPAFGFLLKQAQIPFHEIDLVRLRDTRNPIVHAKFLARFWPNIAVLRRLIREHHVEIVHTNGLMNIQAAIAARLERVKLVWDLNDVGTPRLLRLTLLPLVRSWADRIAIVSRGVGQYYFPNPVSLDGRLHVSYAPVDTQRFNPQVDGSPVRVEFGIANDCPVVGIVANVGPGKGFEYLLEAAPAIKQRYPTAKFLFVGGMLQNRRAYWTSLHHRTKELGLEKDVFFTGRRYDVPKIMRAMTVFVQASESEACPMAVLEASASGLPVVATDVGGTRELVQDGVTGLLIKPRQPSEIADAVIRLLEYPELARHMREAGVERMRRFFSLDICVAEQIRLYNAVLGRAADPHNEAALPAETPQGIRDAYSRN